MPTDPDDPSQEPLGSTSASPAPTARTVRQALVIFNRNAGGGRHHPRLEAILQRLRDGGVAVDIHVTTFAGDAERTVRAARETKDAGKGPDMVICAGGDGTINEVINGLAGGTMPLALLPIGTANVLAAEIGLDLSNDAILETIFSGQVTPIHLGVANGRCFALMVGVGLDAEVVAAVDPKLKRSAGKLAYALATFNRWIAYRGIRYQVTIDGVRYEAASAIVANGHYYAGRFVAAAGARITEPGLHVCLFEKPGRWQAVYYMIALFGGFLDRLNTYRIIQATTVSVTGDADGPVQGDGDVLTRLPVTVSVSPYTVPLIVPVR
jgi:diacylglycerol kinase (ATP)